MKNINISKKELIALLLTMIIFISSAIYVTHYCLKNKQNNEVNFEVNNNFNCLKSLNFYKNMDYKVMLDYPEELIETNENIESCNYVLCLFSTLPDNIINYLKRNNTKIIFTNKNEEHKSWLGGSSIDFSFESNSSKIKGASPIIYYYTDNEKFNNTIIHEVTHQLDFQYNIQKGYLEEEDNNFSISNSSEWKKICEKYDDKLSKVFYQYTSNDIHEVFARVGVLYFRDPEFLKENFNEIFVFMDNFIKKLD